MAPDEGLSLRLEVPSPDWSIGDEVEIWAVLTNSLDRPLVLRLGAHAGDTPGGAALAAAGLWSEVLQNVPLACLVSPGHYMQHEPENMLNGGRGCWATQIGEASGGEFIFGSEDGRESQIQSVVWRDRGDSAGVAEMKIEAWTGSWQLLCQWTCAKTPLEQAHYLPDDAVVSASQWRVTFIRPHGKGGFIVKGLKLLAQVPAEEDRPSWLPAKTLQPRAITGEPAVVFRHRALYLPARTTARVPMRGRVCRAGTGCSVGAALRFGGGPGDQAEVWVPLPYPDVASSSSGAVPDTGSPGHARAAVRGAPHRLRLVLRGVPTTPMRTRAEFLLAAQELAWAWVGPHEPPRPPTEGDHWVGVATSAPVAVSVRPVGGAAPAPKRRDTGGRATSRKAILPSNWPKPRALAGPRARSADGATARAASGGPEGAAKTGGATPRLPRLAEAAKHTGPEHGTKWRGVARCQDPLADPVLLELAEMIHDLRQRSHKASVALCGERAKTRTGQRFAQTVRALGAKVLRAPDVRALAAWAEAPRHVGPPEDLVLVADWHVLGSCLGVLRKAAEERGLTSELLGVVALCELRETQEAAATVASARLHCPCSVVPSLAF